MLSPVRPPIPAQPADRSVSLLIPAEEAAGRRREREGPLEIGRVLLWVLGSVCAAAGSAVWLGRGPASLPALGLLIFGSLLVVLGVVESVLLRSAKANAPEAAHIWDEGVELILSSGGVRGVLWEDPKLALDVYLRARRGTSEPERLLVWLMDGGIPPCDLSPTGFERIESAVVAHHLGCTEVRRGRHGRETRILSIRPGVRFATFDGLEGAPPRSTAASYARREQE